MMYYRISFFYLFLFVSCSLFSAADSFKSCPAEKRSAHFTLKCGDTYVFDPLKVHDANVGLLMQDSMHYDFMQGRPSFLTLRCYTKKNGIEVFDWFAPSQLKRLDSYHSSSLPTHKKRVSQFIVWQRGKDLRSVTFKDSVEKMEWPAYMFDRARTADVWTLTGDLCVERNQWDDAVDCWTRGAQWLKDHKQSCADLLFFIGQAHESKGYFQKAFLYYHHALPMFDAEKKAMGELLFRMGVVSEKDHKLSRAKRHYKEAALKLKEKKMNQGLVLASLASIYFVEGNYLKALDYYGHAEEQLGFHLFKKHANNVGLIYEKMGDNEQALKYYELALENGKQRYFALICILFQSTLDGFLVKSFLGQEKLYDCAQTYIHLVEAEELITKLPKEWHERSAIAYTRAQEIIEVFNQMV